MRCFVVLGRAVFFLVAAAVLATGSAQAQTTFGTDFWLTFPFNFGDSALTVDVILLSDSNTTVTIDAPFAASIPLVAGEPDRHALPVAAMLTTNATVESGVHLSALDPFTATAVNAASYSVGSFLVRPELQLGTSYVVLTYPADGVIGVSAFAVVATQAGTTVTITTTVNAGGIPAHTPTQMILGEGDAVQVFAGGAGEDLSGSTVAADAPVAVFGANSCAFVPINSGGGCDHTVEQLAPTSALGTEFVALPSDGTFQDWDRLRIVGAFDSTTITWDPPVPGAPSTIGAGHVIEIDLLEPVRIVTDKRVQAARFAVNLNDGPMGQHGGTFQAEIVGVDTFANRHTFFVDNYTGTVGLVDSSFYVDIVTTSPECAFVDGMRVWPGEFVRIGTSSYLAAHVSVGPGRHVVESDPASGVTVYGYADWERHGTTAAGSVGPVDCGLFFDDFESGNPGAWSSVSP